MAHSRSLLPAASLEMLVHVVQEARKRPQVPPAPMTASWSAQTDQSMLAPQLGWSLTGSRNQRQGLPNRPGKLQWKEFEVS